MTKARITVTCCDRCGEHAEEVDQTNGGRFDVFVENFRIEECLHCGMRACQSCRDNRDCCEAETESKALARKRGQLFEHYG
jgi:hypothetical protein